MLLISKAASHKKELTQEFSVFSGSFFWTLREIILNHLSYYIWFPFWTVHIRTFQVNTFFVSFVGVKFKMYTWNIKISDIVLVSCQQGDTAAVPFWTNLVIHLKQNIWRNLRNSLTRAIMWIFYFRIKPMHERYFKIQILVSLSL